MKRKSSLTQIYDLWSDGKGGVMVYRDEGLNSQ